MAQKGHKTTRHDRRQHFKNKTPKPFTRHHSGRFAVDPRISIVQIVEFFLEVILSISRY